jgi:hypothetical protein
MPLEDAVPLNDQDDPLPVEPVEGQEAAGADQPPALPVPSPEDELIRLRRENTAYQETIASLARGREGVPAAQPQTLPTGGAVRVGDYTLPQALVDDLRAKGFDDEAIKNNTSAVMPYLGAFVAPLAQEFQTQANQIRDDMQVLRMGQNPIKYPHFDQVAEKMDTVRKDAGRRGEALSWETAYMVAVASDPTLRGPASTNTAARQRATAAGVDDLGGGVATARQGQSPIDSITEDALQRMTYEERKAFYARVGDLPLQ